MPNYPNASGTSSIPTSPPSALYQGDTGLAFSAEQPVTGQASQRFAVAYGPENVPAKVCVEVFFAAAPGAFEFDIQEADTDSDISYVTIAGVGVINAVNANNSARVDLSPFTGKFIRILSKTQNANAVNATVRISR